MAVAVAACRTGEGHSMADPLPGGSKAGWVGAGERSGESALV